MGNCLAKNNAVYHDQESGANSPILSDQTSSLSGSVTALDFQGVVLGTEIMCRDVFRSKYTGKEIHKWRPAKFIEVHNRSSQIRVNYIGWKNSFDITLDLSLEEDRIRLAPESILKSKQIDNGRELSTKQQKVALEYLCRSKNTSSDKSSTSLGRRKSLSRSDTGDSVDPNDDNHFDVSSFRVGTEVDVQDTLGIPSPRGSGTATPFSFSHDGIESATEDFIRRRSSTRWRKGVVQEVSGSKLRIHYKGTSDDWDEVIDMSMEAQRVRSNDFTSKNSRYNTSPTNRRRKSLGHPWNATVGSLAENMTLDGGMEYDHEASYLDADALESIKRDTPESSLAHISHNAVPTGRTLSALSGERSSITTTPKTPHLPGSPTPRSRRKQSRRRSSFPGVRSSFFEDQFAERMADAGMHVVETEMDGNCLFHAVAHQIYMDQNRHVELRNSCVKHMHKHRDRFAPFCATDFDKYLSRIGRDGSWGDDLEIKALEEIIDRVFVIYNSEEKVIAPMVTSFDDAKVLADANGGKAVPPIRLSYHGHSHYNSIFDERTPLPLEPRGSSVLLNHRIASYK